MFDFLDDPECVALLAANGATLDSIDKDGRNAFHHACANGESETLSNLLKLASEQGQEDAFAATDDASNSPLMEAFMTSRTECATLLLEYDNVGEPVSNEGWYPIHYAAKLGDADLVERVMKHSSFVRGAKTKDGMRANVVAMKAGTWHGKVKELIRAHDYLDWSDQPTISMVYLRTSVHENASQSGYE